MGDLVYLTFLFGLWLAVVAVVVYASVRRESGGKSRRTWVVGVGLVLALFDGGLRVSELTQLHCQDAELGTGAHLRRWRGHC